MADEDDDPIELSAHALDALNEFFREQREAAERIRNKDNIDDDEDETEGEDWELSQFWYDRTTSERLSNECLRLVSSMESPRIACISCPTLYKSLKKRSTTVASNVRLSLFEFDRRFDRFGEDFVFYDYRRPVDESLAEIVDNGDGEQKFDVVAVDPPFLSEECQSRVCQFVDRLLKPDGKIIYCTGLIAEQFVMDGLKHRNVRMCRTFEPQHRNKLGNEFGCFVNYDGAFPPGE